MNKMKWREVAVDPLFNLECYLDSQDKEIDRLNNIINELEKYLEEQSTNLNRMSCSGHVYFMYLEDENILNKLKELKESGNNE